jgi:hypothetical protein
VALVCLDSEEPASEKKQRVIYQTHSSPLVIFKDSLRDSHGDHPFDAHCGAPFNPAKRNTAKVQMTQMMRPGMVSQPNNAVAAPPSMTTPFIVRDLGEQADYGHLPRKLMDLNGAMSAWTC